MAAKKTKFVYNADLNKVKNFRIRCTVDNYECELYVLASSEDRAILAGKERYPGADVRATPMIGRIVVSNEYGPF